MIIFKYHIRICLVLILCLWARRIFGISLLGHLNPLGRFWTNKERPSFIRYPIKLASIESFRSFSCAGRENQLYPDLASSCYSYFRCLGGVTYSYTCKNGELFDMTSKECRPKDDVDCPSKPPTTEKCVQQPDGFYPDYDDDCASYYRCYNGTVDETHKCEENSIWDSATGSCGSGRHVVCLPPSCLGLSEGFYPLPGSACTAYYSCNDGYRTDMLCPFGSIFDYKKKHCVSGMDTVCYERACEDRVNGLYSSPQASCGTFYKCFNGAMVQLEECPSGQIFDGFGCVFKTNFSCWRNKDLERCDNKYDGYYRSLNTDCQGFYFCKDQIKIRSFRCDKGLIFNGEKCVRAHNHMCSPRPPLPDCTNKLDGYYTLDKTHCKRFYRCKNGKKLSEHKCPNNYVFNGYHCVSPLFHTCNHNQMGSDRSLPNNGVYPNFKQEY